MRYGIAEIPKAVDGVMSQQLAGLRDLLGGLGNGGGEPDAGGLTFSG